MTTGKCIERGDCCGENTDTCFARDSGGALGSPEVPGRCCFKNGKDGTNRRDDNDCGGSKTTFGRWGWTNGPYNFATDLPVNLTFYCGAAQCKIDGKTNLGIVTIVTDEEKKITATWITSMPNFWKMHLGCGSGEGTALPADSGVYPVITTGQGDKYTVAPGQYEFSSSSDTIEVLERPDLAKCDELWIIIHTCNAD
mgnify:CR=1 FL=1